MQLTSIDLQNFRQFKDVHVDFAPGNTDKNVTIIIGQNGAGKTTIEQAFFWCLYGTTNFSDKDLLNKDVSQGLMPTKTADVVVKIKLQHKGTDYTLTRQMRCTKTYGGAIKSDTPVLNISYKNEYGQEKYFKPNEVAAEVQDILPQALSRYFFFDGERITEMSKEIASDKKVGDFEDAVRGMLGLDAVMNAIKHFKPGNKSSVIGQYNAKFNAGANEELKQILNRLAQAEEKQGIIDEQIEQLAEDTKKAEQRRDQKKDEIRTYADGLKLQKTKDALQLDIEYAEEAKHQAIAEAVAAFNRDLSSFVSYSLIDRAADFLNSQDIADADLPYVRDKTLDYLIVHKRCLCGRDLLPNTEAYQHIMDLYDKVYPKSIATIAKDFKNESRNRIQFPGDMYQDVVGKIQVANKQDEIITDKHDELTRVVKGMTGSDIKSKVAALNSEIDACIARIRKNSQQNNSLHEQKGSLEKQIRNDQERRSEINAANDNNKRIEICLAYANKIYDSLNTYYTTHESAVRGNLENTINSIFKDIYDGELHLEINSNYHISVRDTRYESGVETSSGQSVAVIFAFITALIKMAKDNAKEKNGLLAHEVYPLVMDAPLSMFDKTRIDTVCRTIPTIAEQVVIFIKDTEGDIAKEKMAAFIGKEYRFDKQSEFDTRIVPEA